jgi:hypothetical protein
VEGREYMVFNKPEIAQKLKMMNFKKSVTRI